MEDWQIPSAAESRATDLCYDAFEAVDILQKKRIAERAIKIYPRCVEAWSILGYCYREGDEIIDLQKSLECCDKALSYAHPKLKQDNTKADWCCIESRPFLRAYDNKLRALEKIGLIDEFIVLGEKFLRVLSDDVFNVRFRLIYVYFIRNDLNNVRRLVDLFKRRSDFGIDMKYIQLLLSFADFKTGCVPEETVEGFLIAALIANPFVPTCLLSTSPLYTPQLSSANSGGIAESMQRKGMDG
jgi:tetratricopeptide (TPR) repeat protein